MFRTDINSYKSKVSSKSGNSVLLCGLVLNLGQCGNACSGTILKETYGSTCPVAAAEAWRWSDASCRPLLIEANLLLTQSRLREER